MATVQGLLNGNAAGRRHECAGVDAICTAVDNWLAGEGTHRGVRVELSAEEAAQLGAYEATGGEWVLPLGGDREPVLAIVES